MKNPLWLPIAIFATVISSVQSFGELEAPSLKWGGFVSLREGQIVKGESETTLKNELKNHHVWVQEMVGGLTLESKFKNLPATGNIGVEVAVNTDNIAFPQDLGRSRRLNFYWYLSQADLLFNIIDKDNSALELDIGYFPYKYNDDVRNLGEYLFRSKAYPQYISTEIDFPQTRLLGLRLGGSLLNKTLDFDIILNTNIEWVAINDLNLSGIFTWKPAPVFELGIGGSWCSIVSADLDKTTPLNPGSEYLVAKKDDPYDSLRYNYTFAGQKLMGRLSFDVKQLFPELNMYGKEDLKIYSEAALLGLINYPVSRDGFTNYDTLWQRIPVMAGINWPTHPLLSYTIVPALMAFGLRDKDYFDISDIVNAPVLAATGTGILSGLGLWLLEKKFNIKTGLDILSFELEWFGCQYPNSMNSQKFENEPVPLSSYANEKEADNLNVHDDDWKWSIYFKKTFYENFSIMGQFARDHIKWHRFEYSAMDSKDALRKKDNWYYTLKLNYAF